MDDAKLCVLSACDGSLESKKLVYYMYMYQLSGFKFNFKYSIGAHGLVCRGLNDYLCEVVGAGELVVRGTCVCLTSLGEEKFDDVVRTLQEWEVLDNVKVFLDNLSCGELYLLCLVDMFVYDVMGRYGAEGLMKQEAQIKHSIGSLMGYFSDEDFNTAVGVVNKLRSVIK